MPDFTVMPPQQLRPALVTQGARQAAIPGAPGRSAYQSAVLVDGFVGTEAQWLHSFGETAYSVEQVAPSASWVFPNSGGTACGVWVLVNDAQVLADVSVTSTNISVAFASPQSGRLVIQPT